MYVDDGTGNDGDITVEVDGEQYSEQANVDLNEDGIGDGIAVRTDDGITVYADSDGDGSADQYAELDSQGNVRVAAEYDSARGQWVSTGEDGDDTGSQANTDPGKTITVDGPDGDLDAGPATVDTDHDGTADTAVVDDGEGGKILVTDANGNGDADVLTQVSATGEVEVDRHTGDGQWTVTEHGHIDQQGEYHRDSGGSGARSEDGTSDALWGGSGASSGADSVARIDTVTGQWISRN